MTVRAVKMLVTGRVQRVGYRRYVLDTAQEHSVAGYVRNERDGSVSIFAQGEKPKLQQFLAKVRKPPQPARVNEVREEKARPKPKVKYFSMRFGSTGEELQEGFGAMQTEFRDYRSEFKGFTGEFRDYRDEFRDYRDEFRDYRDEFRGFTGEFRDYRSEFRDYVGEFRDYREEFRGFAARTDENFNQLGQKYGEISEKLTKIMDALAEESKKSREMLEEMREESKAGRETLAESLGLLREAVNRLPKQQ